MAVVGLVLTGWPGHDNPARRFGRVLSEAGHEVLGWTPEELGAGRPGGREAPAAAAVGQHLAARLAGLAVELTGPAIERLDQHEVDLVVHDSMTPWGRLAADWLGLPRIGSLTHYPGPLLQPPAGGRSIAAGGQVGRSRRVLLEKWGIDVGEESELVFNAGDVTLLYTIPS